MLGHPKPKEYTAIEDEETANLSETESNEDFLQHKNRRYVRSRQSVWVPWVRCNTAGTILLVAIAAAAVCQCYSSLVFVANRVYADPLPAAPLYDYYWGSRGYGFAPPAVFARRLNHCVDVLQQHLMCHADLEPFVSNWRVGQEKPYADFAVRKTCVDFDYLLEWSERHKDPRHTELVRLLRSPHPLLCTSQIPPS